MCINMRKNFLHFSPQQSTSVIVTSHFITMIGCYNFLELTHRIKQTITRPHCRAASASWKLEFGKTRDIFRSLGLEALMQGFFLGSSVLSQTRSATDLEELRLDLGSSTSQPVGCKFDPPPWLDKTAKVPLSKGSQLQTPTVCVSPVSTAPPCGSMCGLSGVSVLREAVQRKTVGVENKTSGKQCTEGLCTACKQYRFHMLWNLGQKVCLAGSCCCDKSSKGFNRQIAR